MKILSRQTMKRVQFIKEGKNVGQSGSVVSGRRKALSKYVLKKLVWKVKSECRKALSLQRSSMHFAYDFQSYSLNFDDGVSSRRATAMSC